MSFACRQLGDLLVRHEAVVRVVIVEARGSTPRDVGAAMLVYPDGQSGTIGGGALEQMAFVNAEAMLHGGGLRVQNFALGPGLGQCCGGAVRLLSECFANPDTLPKPGVYARHLDKSEVAMPFGVRRLCAEGIASATLCSGWFLESVDVPGRAVWIYGAGHVGRALVECLAPLHEFSITWVDTAESRFPSSLPTGVRILVGKNPADVVRYAPADAVHLTLTYSHAYDLEICHRVLGQNFQFLGLIGSKTKAMRFRRQLERLGHSSGQIARLVSPIGEPELGKQPQAIALGVACTLLREHVLWQYTSSVSSSAHENIACPPCLPSTL